ncbi:uncharacterized protein HMPREF1541_04088 [Cyphellophora europaea CBS 101466]|uniref:Uncharacterized protein n=1 Tax=Cyphellophora europaea (strain CBS 101466) TaxID=1220924 RepID=W2S0C9_CYPE1|nr:uncharacterized protein HMPREF1541_04088 [Cyphellophora europaea CBS 101466]ETN42147.1 hypothetical protein HMPREF1541_04088 [Cyphellophora europaea CBS 101466]
MNMLISFALLLSAHVQAQRYGLPRRLEARGTFSGNETAPYTNSSITTSWTSTLDHAPSLSPPSTSTEQKSTDSLKPPLPDQTSTLTGSEKPEPTGGPPGGDADGAVCRGGMLTYYGSVYPTVYSTVTEIYNVTLSAVNATMTDSETLMTPSQAACGYTVVPINGPEQAIATIEGTVDPALPQPKQTVLSTGLSPDNMTLVDGTPFTETMSIGSPSRSGAPRPPKFPAAPVPETGERPSPVVGGRPPAASMKGSTIYATAPYTSTVIVTKKTPVPVLPTAQSPPPVFQNPPPTQDRKPPVQETGGRPGAGGDSVGGPSGGAPGGPKDDSGVVSLIQISNGIGISAGPNGIDSIPATATGGVAPQTTIDDVPIAVQRSSVFFGSSAVAIPTGRDEAVITQGDATFTLRSNAIAGQSTTVAFGPLSPQGVVSVPPTRVTAAPGVVVEVAGSTAVVAGTTFRLDERFSTVITVSGQRVSIGPSGIGLPSTTILAGLVTQAPAMVETVGDVTFTLDGSRVIISGSTYGIATDSPTVTTEFDGEEVSIGPGGIGFDSTTFKPTQAETSTREDMAQATGSAGGGDGDDGSDSNGASLPGKSLWGALASLLALLVVL